MKKKSDSGDATRRDRTLINSYLRRIFKRLEGPSILRKAMEYAVFGGGKRLRPILVIESCRALGGGTKKALPVACAVELVHNFSLVHDDLPALDNDDIRRGKPTCHKKFSEALAILTGDALLNLAFGILSNSKEKKSLEVISELSNAIGVRNMIGGQTLDLEYKNHSKKSCKLKQKIDSMKTASLIALSCKAGALVAGAKPKDTKRMYEFGRDFGLAFQVVDDIKDSRHNKNTLKKMKREAGQFISKGKRCIASLKNRADTLRYIADSILEKVTSDK